MIRVVSIRDWFRRRPKRPAPPVDAAPPSAERAAWRPTVGGISNADMAARARQRQGPGVVDLRSQKDRDAEARAKQPLPGDGERIAEALVRLIALFDEQASQYSPGMDRAASEKTHQQIVDVGQSLCADGGHERMLQIAHRVAVLGLGRRVSSRDVEFHWDGICGWRW